MNWQENFRWVGHLLIAFALMFTFYLASRDAVLLAFYGKYTHAVVAAPADNKRGSAVVRFTGIQYDGHFTAVTLPHPAPVGFGFDVVYLPNDPKVVTFAKRGDSLLLLITRSVGFLPTLLLSVGIAYFLFRGMAEAGDYFSPPQPEPGTPHPPRPQHLPARDVWNGDLSGIPEHEVRKPEAAVDYPGSVPLSLQPGESVPHGRSVPAPPGRLIPLQPEERHPGAGPKDDMSPKG